MNKSSKIHEIMENIIYMMPNYNFFFFKKKKINGQQAYGIKNAATGTCEGKAGKTLGPQHHGQMLMERGERERGGGVC